MLRACAHALRPSPARASPRISHSNFYQMQVARGPSRFLAARSRAATTLAGSLDFGGVSRKLRVAERPDLVPTGYVETIHEAGVRSRDGELPVSARTAEHLRWMAQKDALRQGLSVFRRASLFM